MKLSVFSRRAAGFTMIELLVVIAILVVLGTTAFVVVGRAMGSGDLAKCREHMEQLGRLGLVYKDERFNYGRLPTSGMDDKEKTELLDESEGWWVALAQKSDDYMLPAAEGEPMKVSVIFHCPADERSKVTDAMFEATPESVSYVSWSDASRYASDEASEDEEGEEVNPNAPIRTARRSDLAGMPWLSDGEPVRGQSVTDFESFKRMVAPAATRHDNKIVVLYADLSVKAVDVSDIDDPQGAAKIYREMAPSMPDAADAGKASEGKKRSGGKKPSRKPRASRNEE